MLNPNPQPLRMYLETASFKVKLKGGHRREPYSNTTGVICPYKGRSRHSQTRRDDHVRSQGEGGPSRREVVMRNQEVDPLILDLKPPESQENKCLWFKPPCPGHFVVAAGQTNLLSHLICFLGRLSTGCRAVGFSGFRACLAYPRE